VVGVNFEFREAVFRMLKVESVFFVVYLDWPNQKAELDSATKPVKSFVRFSIRTSIVKVSRKRETILVDFKEFFLKEEVVWFGLKG